jgi:cytochrome c oxidase subunit II
MNSNKIRQAGSSAMLSVAVSVRDAIRGVALTVALGYSGLALAVGDMPGGPKVDGLNLREPVTHIASEEMWMHNFLLWICLVIFVGVFSVMFYSVWAHRKSRGAKAAEFHESTAVEIAWTVVPFLIVIGMAFPATRMIVEQKDTSNPDITVKATGYQWKWGYDYVKGEGEGISFLSQLSTPRDQINNLAPKSDTYLMEVDHPLVVPVNKKIRVVTTANDVIHSWTVQSFGVKQDAIPGFVRDTWFRAEKVGTYRGNCVELCGKDHAFMPIVVEVKSDEDYAKWVAERKKEMLALQDDPNKEWTLAELVARGEKVFGQNCVACHQANGQGVPGAFPALVGSKTVLGPKSGQILTVLNGRAGTAMQAFKQQLSDVELASVITYTRNSWGQKADENVVQPKDVMAERK